MLKGTIDAEVAVDNGLDIGACPVDLAVDESFEIARSVVRGRPVQSDHLNVVGRDEAGGQVSGDEEPARVVGVTDAHVAESIEDAVADENAIRIDEILSNP